MKYQFQQVVVRATDLGSQIQRHLAFKTQYMYCLILSACSFTLFSSSYKPQAHEHGQSKEGGARRFANLFKKINTKNVCISNGQSYLLKLFNKTTLDEFTRNFLQKATNCLKMRYRSQTLGLGFLISREPYITRFAINERTLPNVYKSPE